MERQAVIDKIAKLLRLAEGDGASANEAANAAAKAQELMDRHKLSRALIDDRALEDGDPIGSFEQEPLMQDMLTRWRIRLADAVARMNDCVMLLRSLSRDGIKGRAYLVGRTSDVEVSRYMFTYLNREIDRIGRAALQQLDEAPREPDVWLNDFCYGAASVVFRRLQDARVNVQRDALKNEAGKKALVALRDRSAAVDAFVKELTGGRQIKLGAKGVDLQAHMAGRSAGETIPIHEAVTSDGEPPKQIGGGS